MMVTCIISEPRKIEKKFSKLLQEAGYVEISENSFVHEGGEQLTAVINFGKTYLSEIKDVRECLTLYLSDAEHVINIELCNRINEILSTEIELK